MTSSGSVLVGVPLPEDFVSKAETVAETTGCRLIFLALPRTKIEWEGLERIYNELKELLQYDAIGEFNPVAELALLCWRIDTGFFRAADVIPATVISINQMMLEKAVQLETKYGLRVVREWDEAMEALPREPLSVPERKILERAQMPQNEPLGPIISDERLIGRWRVLLEGIDCSLHSVMAKLLEAQEHYMAKRGMRYHDELDPNAPERHIVKFVFPIVRAAWGQLIQKVEVCDKGEERELYRAGPPPCDNEEQLLVWVETVVEKLVNALEYQTQIRVAVPLTFGLCDEGWKFGALLCEPDKS